MTQKKTAPLTTRRLKFTGVRVFGPVEPPDNKIYRGDKVVTYFGQTPHGKKLTKIATDHMAAGHVVHYEEFRKLTEPHSVFANCVITPPREF